jgi:hypothetical protein
MYEESSILATDSKTVADTLVSPNENDSQLDRGDVSGGILHRSTPHACIIVHTYWTAFTDRPVSSSKDPSPIVVK